MMLEEDALDEIEDAEAIVDRHKSAKFNPRELGKSVKKVLDKLKRVDQCMGNKADATEVLREAKSSTTGRGKNLVCVCVFVFE